MDPRESGLSHRLYFSIGRYASIRPHGPRFRIEVDPHHWLSINLDNPQCPNQIAAEEWRAILQFVKNNKGIIHMLWQGKITDGLFQTALITHQACAFSSWLSAALLYWNTLSEKTVPWSMNDAIKANGVTAEQFVQSWSNG